MKPLELKPGQAGVILKGLERGLCGLCGASVLLPWTTCLDCESRLEMTVATLDDVINQLKGSTDEN